MVRLDTESWLSRAGLMKARRTGMGTTKGPPETDEAATIGVLAFEVASLMSKAAHLWHFLEDEQILRLRTVVLRTDGVRKLVSEDDDFLLGLALAEMLDSVGSLARSVAHLGRRCSNPVLQRFMHVLTELMENEADPYRLVYLGRKMERKVNKMVRLVAASTCLYQEMELLRELEQALQRMRARGGPGGQLADFRREVNRQRMEVRRLQEMSPWNLSYDYTARLLGRSLFTIVAKIRHVFGFYHINDAIAIGGKYSGRVRAPRVLPRCRCIAGLTDHTSIRLPRDGREPTNMFSSNPSSESAANAMSGPIIADMERGCLPHSGLHHPYRTKRNAGRRRWTVISSLPLMGCVAGGSQSPVLQLQRYVAVEGGLQRSDPVRGISNNAQKTASEARIQLGFSNMSLTLCPYDDSGCKLLGAIPSTLGAAALALHYANIIVLIEKLVASPTLITPDARDDLYHMLPASIKAALRRRLKPRAKTLASDPILAAEWSDALTRILEWLAPLAHNMIRWQSERKNFQQKHLDSKTNILLLQTLYYADQAKTEAAIMDLLLGLDYLRKFGRNLNEKATIIRVSKNLDDCSHSYPGLSSGDFIR